MRPIAGVSLPTAVGALAILLLVAAVGPLVHAYDNGVARLPPMGWNTWCTDDICGLFDKCSEDLVRQQADALVASGMREFGYRYVIMDDCWSAKTRDDEGRLQPDANRFPHGMRALADYVHALGLKLGAYSCIGTHTCRNGLPGSFGHYATDAETFANWTLDLVKTDNCAKPGQFTDQELFTNFSHQLNKTGHPMLFALCEWGVDNVEEWGGKVGQQFRVQMDHLPAWWLPTHGAGKGYGQGTWNIIEYVATLKPSSFVRPHAWMDPGVVMTLFPTFTVQQSRVEFSFWSLWSAPLVIATHVNNMSEAKRHILLNQAVIDINQDPLSVAGDRLYNHSDGSQLWARPLANGDAALILYNNQLLDLFGNVTVTVPWQQLNIAAGSSWVMIRDLWSDMTWNASTADTFQASVSFSDALMVRVTCSAPPCIKSMGRLNYQV